jgi:hypothetical protein
VVLGEENRHHPMREPVERRGAPRFFLDSIFSTAENTINQRSFHAAQRQVRGEEQTGNTNGH